MGRILVVEDNDASLKLVRDLLELHGHEVVAVTTGAEGLRRAGEGGIDVVLLDVGLPDVPGTDVLAALRASEATASVAVVAVTASAMQGDEERLLAAGFDGYLAKPIDVATFVADVERLAARGHRG